MFVSDTAQIREADRLQIEEMGLPGIILMEDAGRGSAKLISEKYPGPACFVILAGPGNNGGDGLVIARYLHLWGRRVQVILSHPADKYKGDAAINYHLISRLPVPVEIYAAGKISEIAAKKPVVLVDALLGTGVRSAVKGNIADMIEEALPLGLPVAAVDLPSGLNADTGEQICPVLKAEITLTFQLPKLCHYLSPASLNCGEVKVVDIGIWPRIIDSLGIRRRLVDEEFVRKHYKKRPPEAHKGNFGHVLFIGGSRDMSGAPALAAFAAIQAGAGLVTALVPGACRAALNSIAPEAMCLSYGDAETGSLDENAIHLLQKGLEGKNVVLLGPGMGNSPATQAFLSAALPMIGVPMVWDADALNILSELPELWQYLGSQTILTPHPGEMRRLQPGRDPISQRLECAESLAADKGVSIVLKGRGTLMCMPDGQTLINTSGNPGMASGGMGDVLTGMIGAFLAQGYPIETGLPLAVFLHGKSADLLAEAGSAESVTASAVAARLGIALLACLE